MGDIGNCVKCGNNAAWNTPFINKKKQVFCNSCAKESQIMLQGIDQWKDDKGKPTKVGEFTKNHVVLWADRHGETCAWYNDGGTAFPLADYEKELAIKNPERIIDLIIYVLSNNKFRCTSCESTIDDEDEGGRPLFAGRVCKKCWKKHEEHLKEEKRSGHVCGMCGKPYSACYC